MESKQRIRYPEIAPGGVAAMSAVERYLNVGESLPAVLLELVRLRCSLLNGCEYCIALHSSELRKHNEPETRIEGAGEWRGTDAFTAKEQAALRWAEVVTNIQDGHASEQEFAAVQAHFSDVELVNLTIAIASINAFNRMAIAFRPQWQGNKPVAGDERSTVGDDGGKVTEE